MKNNRGFSLLELLIVVAIILIIATIAIPSLLRSRQAANESAAVSNLRTINTAEVTYLSSAGGQFGGLTDLVSAGLLDTRFNTAGTPPGVSGYTFSVTANLQDYTATANPASSNGGRYAYFSWPDAVIKYQTISGSCGSTTGDCFPTNMSGMPVQ
jgi:prepilin-type N-terminal cleavage/methylation domain-containing protein